MKQRKPGHLNETRFLDLNDLIIKIENISYVKDIEYSNGHWYAIRNEELNKIKKVKSIDKKTLYENFVHLGKLLYDKYKCIKKIQYREGIEIYNCDYLIFDKSSFNNKIKETILNWCKDNPVAIIKDRDVENNVDHEHQEEIEIFVLIDIAIFTYLVLSSFNNYLLRKRNDEEDIKEYECGNKIGFNDFMEIREDERDKFLKIITNIIDHYETKIYNIDNRPLLQERTTLTYNDVSHKCIFSRTFENIYSAFWIMLKGQLFAMSNNNEVFHICRCGNVILDGSWHCEICFKQLDSDRHNKEKSN